MGDLETITAHYPAFNAYLKRSIDAITEIRSFDDIERIFLRAQGLSPNTYRNYLQAVKEMYEFTGGLNPFQWDAPRLEQFYDAERERNGINTAAGKIYGIKNFLVQVARHFPFFTTPFESMTPELIKKLSKTTLGEQKPALNHQELKALFDYLSHDQTLLGRQNHAMIFFLSTTGLRAQELCNVRFEDFDRNPFNGQWTLRGAGKGRSGGKTFLIPIWDEVMNMCQSTFRMATGREYRPSDALFHTLPCNKTSGVFKPINKPVLWSRLKKIESEVKAQGIIRSNLEFSAHLFRRTFLTLLSQAGMPLRDLQAAARHANITTTAKHYLDSQANTIEYVSRIFQEVL